jgi:hypothetical protein
MEKLNSDRICVQVFAKISAAISHEIKNTLSIINENAGLLDDYAQMAEQTGGLPIDRVLAITSTIAKQVDRSNMIMKNLNRYAHSGDTRLAHANLKDTLTLVTALASRQAAMKEISVTVDCLPDIAFFTHLMPLECLIYLTMLSLYEDCEAGNTLTLHGIEDQGNITVSFTIMEEKVIQPGTYPDDDQQLLAKLVSASYRHEKNQLSIAFPGKIDCHTSP